MKSLSMFYLSDCGYCGKVFYALDELCSEIPAFRDIPIEKIEESQHPDISDRYDYYAVPSFFDGSKKLFEAQLFMRYEDIREEIQRIPVYALF